MNRAVWFAAGAAAGAYVSTRVRRVAEAVTVDGIHDRLSGLFAGARLFGDEVRAGMTEKETQLRAQLGSRPPGEAGLPGEAGRGPIDAGPDRALQGGHES